MILDLIVWKQKWRGSDCLFDLNSLILVFCKMMIYFCGVFLDLVEFSLILNALVTEMDSRSWRKSRIPAGRAGNWRNSPGRCGNAKGMAFAEDICESLRRNYVI